MAIQLFELGYLLKLRGVTTVLEGLTALQEKLEVVNVQSKQLAGLREAGTHLAMMGAGAMAAGAAIGYPLMKAVEEYGAIDHAVKHLTTTLDDGSAGTRELARAQDMAAKLSVKWNDAQTDILDNLYRSQSFLGNWNAAMAVTNASLEVAKGNMGDAATVGGQLAVVFNDFGNKSAPAAAQVQHFADVMAYVSRHGAFHDVTQLNEAMSISIGAARAAGMSYTDLVATLNAFQAAGIQGSEAGSALEESLQAFARGKLQKDLGVALATLKNGSLDVIGTFVNLRHELGAGAISVQQFQKAAAALGIRGERALTVDVDALQKMRDTLNSGAVTGAALQGATVMMSAFNEQTGALGKQWQVIEDAIGKALAPTILAVAQALGGVLGKLAGFAAAHPMIVKAIALFAAFSAVLLIVGGAILVIGGGLAVLASFLAIGGGAIATVVGWGAAVALVAAILITWGGTLAHWASGL